MFDRLGSRLAYPGQKCKLRNNFISKNASEFSEMYKFYFQGKFLPSALRKFFSLVHIPKLGDRERLDRCLAIFSRKYSSDNSHVTLDAVSIMSYAIVLLSVDLTTPPSHIRNKMSKREVSFPEIHDR